MAANTTPIFPAALALALTAFTSADTTVAKNIYTPTLANGARVDCINVTNTDTAGYIVQLFARIGSTNFLIGTAAIPASAGNLSTVQPVNLLEAIAAASSGPSPFLIDPSGNKYLYLGSTASLQLAITTTMTAAKTVAIAVSAGEF